MFYSIPHPQRYPLSFYTGARLENSRRGVHVVVSGRAASCDSSYDCLWEVDEHAGVVRPRLIHGRAGPHRSPLSSSDIERLDRLDLHSGRARRDSSRDVKVAANPHCPTAVPPPDTHPRERIPRS